MYECHPSLLYAHMLQLVGCLVSAMVLPILLQTQLLQRRLKTMRNEEALVAATVLEPTYGDSRITTGLRVVCRMSSWQSITGFIPMRELEVSRSLFEPLWLPIVHPSHWLT